MQEKTIFANPVVQNVPIVLSKQIFAPYVQTRVCFCIENLENVTKPVKLANTQIFKQENVKYALSIARLVIAQTNVPLVKRIQNRSFTCSKAAVMMIVPHR